MTAGSLKSGVIEASGASLARRGGRVSGAGAVVWRLACVVGFAGLTALLAQVRVPVPGTAVPMTLQVLGVLLAGFVCPPLVAASAMVLYVGVGVAGVPVFAPGSAGVWGLTGGYIVGFVLAAWLIAVLRGSSWGAIRLLLAGGVGTGAVFALGAAWQMAWPGVGIWQAVQAGVLPFLPKAFLQLGLAVAAVRGCCVLTGRGGAE